MTSIGFAGRAGWSPMAGDDAAVAGRVQQDVRALASRTKVTGAQLDALVLAMVGNRYRGAVDRLGREPILALTSRPGPGRCTWCNARERCTRANPPRPLPPASAALKALLGAQCGRCRTAWETAAAADRERPLMAAIVAAGANPALSASLRTVEQVDRYRRGTTPPTAPTRAIWPARPAARRVPDPPYYTPNRRRSTGE